MLLLNFKIGKDNYVIDTKDVVEIIPLVNLKTLPGSEPALAGLMNYHSKSVPVIDLNTLCGQEKVTNTLTTRIILVHYHGDILGLITSNVSETVRLEEDAFKPTGIKAGVNEFLGDIAEHNHQLVQRVILDKLLTTSIRDALFTSKETSDGAI